MQAVQDTSTLCGMSEHRLLTIISTTNCANVTYDSLTYNMASAAQTIESNLSHVVRRHTLSALEATVYVVAQTSVHDSVLYRPLTPGDTKMNVAFVISERERLSR